MFRKARLSFLCFALPFLVGSCFSQPRKLQEATSIDFPVIEEFAEETAPYNLSGASTFIRDGQTFLATVTDEGSEFLVLRLGESPKTFYFNLEELSRDIFPESPKEIDLEGVSVLGDHIFLMGSASLKRKKPKGGKLKKDLKRLLTLEPGSGGTIEEPIPHTNQLFVLKLPSSNGELLTPVLEKTIDLRGLLQNDPYLKGFLAIPSKDNGVDFEGIAVTPKSIFLGMRGPVLRGHAVILSLSTPSVLGTSLQNSASIEYQRFFLYLQGFGIRAMAPRDRTSNSPIMISAGPTMTHLGPFHLFQWDGLNHAMSAKIRPRVLKKVGKLPVPDPRAKAEGIFRYQGGLGVLFDGPKGGAPKRIPLP